MRVVYSLPLLFCESTVSVKENLDTKKKRKKSLASTKCSRSTRKLKKDRKKKVIIKMLQRNKENKQR